MSNKYVGKIEDISNRILNHFPICSRDSIFIILVIQ